MTGEVFVELRHEELPVSMIRPALYALRDGLLALLEGVEKGEVAVWATPRRLAVRIGDVAAAKPLVERVVTGPPADRGYDLEGNPTAMAVGFAKGKGVDVSALRVVDGPKGKVLALVVQEGGEETAALLAQGLEKIVLGLPFAKSQEWGVGGVRWGRPLHGVSAIFAGQVLGGSVAGIPIGNCTIGHRLADDREFSFSTSAQWLEGLRARQVEPDFVVRAEWIGRLLAEAAERHGADPIDEPDLLDEVTFLVEWPVLVIGTFDEDLLRLPPKLLVQSMKQHQRYFPVHRGGALTARFVVISNSPWGDEALVAEGNARVLRARFYDARFFLAEDRKKRLEVHGWGLEKMRWIRGLGTMSDKAARVGVLAERLAPDVGADAEHARRAGELCKADLCSQMVGEFPELQGHMGRNYASNDGEPDAVAVAIEEHYAPKSADDAPPESPEGVAVALADRLDTLVGCFGLGMAPKGGGDPQGLRRAALGVVNILVAHGLQIELRGLFSAAFDVFDERARQVGAPSFDKWLAAKPERDALATDLVDFTLTRLKAAETAEGASADLVDAALASTGPSDPVVIHGKVDALKELAKTPDFAAVLQTFKRVLNITKGATFPPPSLEDLSDPAEEALFDAVSIAEGQVRDALAQLDFERALEQALALKAPISAFFDAVLVDAPDPGQRAVRMGLLLRIARLFLLIADFSRISTR